MPYITDADLLAYEPTLLRDCRAVATRFATGVCDVFAGTSLIGTAQILPDDVGIPFGTLIFFPASKATAFIVGFDSPTVLTIASAWWGSALFGPLPAPTADAISFELWTFPQIAQAVQSVQLALGLDDIAGPWVKSALPLTRAIVACTLASIFRSMSLFDHTVWGGPTGTLTLYTANDRYLKVAEHYDKIYQEALFRATITIQYDLHRPTLDKTVSAATPTLQRS